MESTSRDLTAFIMQPEMETVMETETESESESEQQQQLLHGSLGWAGQHPKGQPRKRRAWMDDSSSRQHRQQQRQPRQPQQQLPLQNNINIQYKSNNNDINNGNWQLAATSCSNFLLRTVKNSFDISAAKSASTFCCNLPKKHLLPAPCWSRLCCI